MNKLYFRYGVMGSGKSLDLLHVAHDYEKIGMKILIMKPSVDSKGGEFIVSRISDNISHKVDYLIKPETDIYQELKDKSIDCIIVDEAQFVEPVQVDQLLHLSLTKNIPVICYGLRTDFRTIGFPGAIRLLEVADSIEEIKCVCSCGEKATLNARMINGEFTLDGDQVSIDGSSDAVSYEALCPKCYYKKVKRNV